MAWSQIVGHDSLVEAFTHVVQRNRLAHAYLFSGPAGVGKKLFAHELAKTLLCETRTESAGKLSACDRCQSCVLMDAGNHPDFFTLARPEDLNVIPIELMQELCAGFALKSARGRGKVAVLDGADDLSPQAANCFLKTLEEPPPRSTFILVGTSAGRQMPTILSRCQVVRFRPLTADAIESVLQRNGVEDRSIISRLTRLSDGSPGQALALADPALWEFRSKLLAGFSQAPIDNVGLAKSFIQFVEDAGKDTALQRRRASLVLGLVIAALRDAIAVVSGKVTSDTSDKVVTSLAERADAGRILTLLERCLQAERHIGRYVQLALVLEALLDAMAQTLEEGAAVRAHR